MLGLFSKFPIRTDWLQNGWIVARYYMHICASLHQTVLVCYVNYDFMPDFFSSDFSVTILITGVLNLCAVSYDRLTAIVLPKESRITVRVARLIMCFTWLAGVAIGVPFTIYRNYKVMDQYICPKRLKFRSSNGKFVILLLLFSFTLERNASGKIIMKNIASKIWPFYRFTGT